MSAKSPEECDELGERYMNNCDFDRLAALYEPEASYIGPNGNLTRGRSAIREVLQGLLAQRPKITTNLFRVVRVGDDLAVLYNDWSAEVAGTKVNGKSIEVVRRQYDGTWLFAVDDPFARG